MDDEEEEEEEEDEPVDLILAGFDHHSSHNLLIAYGGLATFS